MVKRKTLMESLSSNLHSFLKQTCKNLSFTDKAEFLLYRLLMGLSETIDACFWLRKDLLHRCPPIPSGRTCKMPMSRKKLSFAIAWPINAAVAVGPCHRYSCRSDSIGSILAAR
jgi:hypothetical protein